MAKKAAKKKTRKNKTTVPIAVVGGIAAGMYDPVRYFAAGNYDYGVEMLTRSYVGYNPRTKELDIKGLRRGLLPLGIGVLVHKVAGKFGVNRMIARTGLPWLRI